MATKIADMEVLEAQEGIETPAEKPKRKTRAAKEVVIEDPVEPQPTVDPVHTVIPFHVMDAILAEISEGKTVTEAVKVDARIDAIFTANPHVIVRESRNSFYYTLKEGVEPQATRSYDGIWSQPVAYALDK